MDVADIKEADLKTLNDAGYAAGDLEMLAESEVKALLLPSSRSDADDSGSDPHGDALEEQNDAEEDAAAVAAAAASAEVEADAAAEAAPAAFVPQYKAEVPADVSKQIADLRSEDAAAFKRLMDGLIDADEYQTTKSRVEAAVDDLRTKAISAEIFNNANAQAAEQQAQSAWTTAENAAMTAFKSEGIDYRGKPALLAAYNVNLKALASVPANEKRDAPWFLAEAHRLTKADLGIAGVKPKPSKDSRGVDIGELPPTLRGVPIAGNGAVNADEFAHMRNLGGVELERAHAALTDAQRDRWMAE